MSELTAADLLERASRESAIYCDKRSSVHEVILRALSLLASVEGSGEEIVKLSGFTPGPWKWGGTGRITSGKKIVADVWNDDNGWIAPQEQANARLIAAAPTMHARIVSSDREKAALRAELASVKAELQYIAEADYRKWEPEMRDPQSFVDWAKSRARHALAAHPKDAQ